jgi:hypothetical protein
MRSPRVGTLGVAGAVAFITGCGTGGPQTPDLSKLPLVAGSSFQVKERVCDSGSNPYCAWQLVLADHQYRDSNALFEAEHRLLIRRHWSGADGDIATQHAADSPGHQLHVTYANPVDELTGIAIFGVRRSQTVSLALSKAIFTHTPVISMMLEVGAY